MTRTLHMCINVRGALMNWDPKSWRNCCKDPATGRTLSPSEVKAEFLEALSQGKEVLPFGGEPCEGFDFAGGGCPGHEKNAADEDAD